MMLGKRIAGLERMAENIEDVQKLVRLTYARLTALC